MVNYVPDTIDKCEQIIEQNFYFKEIFQRREEVENACETCDLVHSDACKDCYHGMYETNLAPVMVQINANDKLAKLSINKRMNLKCPVCSRDWTGTSTVYINSKDGKLMAANIDSRYCPMCGKKFNNN